LILVDKQSNHFKKPRSQEAAYLKKISRALAGGVKLNVKVKNDWCETFSSWLLLWLILKTQNQKS
jgi:hypothetical protein